MYKTHSHSFPHSTWKKVSWSNKKPICFIWRCNNTFFIFCSICLKLGLKCDIFIQFVGCPQATDDMVLREYWAICPSELLVLEKLPSIWFLNWASWRATNDRKAVCCRVFIIAVKEFLWTSSSSHAFSLHTYSFNTKIFATGIGSRRRKKRQLNSFALRRSNMLQINVL